MGSTVRQIWTLLIFLILLSVVSNTRLQFTHSIAGGLYMSLFMWTPSLAALITCALYRRDVRSLGWGWLSVRHKAYRYFLPLAYILPVYIVTWVSIRGSFSIAPF